MSISNSYFNTFDREFLWCTSMNNNNNNSNNMKYGKHIFNLLCKFLSMFAMWNMIQLVAQSCMRKVSNYSLLLCLSKYTKLEHRICDKTFNERHPVPSLNRAPIQNRDIFLKDIRKFIFFQMACYAFKSINVLCLISAPKVILIAMKM